MTLRLGGWWRLWFVLSACYGLGMLLFAWWLWPAASGLSDEKVLARVPDDMLILALPNLKRAEATSPTVVLELPYSRHVEVDGGTSLAEREQISRAFSAAAAAELGAQRLTFAFTVLFVWLIPCVALVIIGAAFNWVHRGFKGKSHEP